MLHLLTPRLILRDHRADDLPTHHALLSDARAMAYLQDIQTDSLEASEMNLRSAMSEIGKPDRKRYFLRIEHRVSGEHIGEIGYTVTAFTPLGKLVDVGYFLRTDHWGQGFAKEALAEVMRFAFEENNVIRMASGCLVENAASERVMQKCGMIREGHLVAAFHEGKLKDRAVYRLLKSEWIQMQSVRS